MREDSGGTFDPANVEIGQVVINSQAAAQRVPDRSWFSTAAGEAIVDAKVPAPTCRSIPMAWTA